MDALHRKILLLLLTGVALSFSYTPQRYWKIIKLADREWKNINREELRREIKKLYQSKMVKRSENSDGSTTIVLTNKGKLKALTYRFEDMRIDRKNWDGKWRLVVFDIPERLRLGRDSLRERIKKLGFHELQKSVFVFPYDCKDEVDFLIEFFNIRKYVRFGILEEIDNEKHLKHIYNLS